MDPNLIRALAAKLGDKTRIEGGSLRTLVQHGDAWLPTRMRTDPVAEVFVTTRPLDGFALAIRWGDRWRDPKVGRADFDAMFALQTNDETMMRAWLDDESRDALLRSAYTYELDEIAMVTLGGLSGTRTWTYELANDEIVVTKGGAEADPDRFMTAVTTACTLAARSHRWAAEYADLARAIGGRGVSEVVIGGEPVLHATRSSIDVTLRLVRTGHGDDRLRTIVSAPRIGDVRLAVWNDDLPKGARPPLPGGDKLALELAGYRARASDPSAARKLDEAAKKLVSIAQPAVIVLDADSVDLWFDGALDELTRIDTAVALAAQLAIDSIAPQGPYR